jgi:streptogramin lyase
MKKLLISAGALAATALSTPAFAATANQATANATVNIVSPLTLTNDSGLDFGTIVGPFNGETVRIDTLGNRNCGGLTCSGTTVSAANFTVSNGTANQELALTVDPSVSLTSGANILSVNLTPDLPTGLVTNASGGATFGIGGSLVIPAGTSDGVYSGTFNVQVDYQ